MTTDTAVLKLEELDLDQETLEEFLATTHESVDEAEHELLTLERDPGCETAINSLFRAVHSMKSNCRMCFIEPLSNYLHALEEVISEVRSRQLVFTPLLREALLMGLDQYKIACDTLIRTGAVELDLLNRVGAHYARIRAASASEAEKISQEVIHHFSSVVGTKVPIIAPNLLLAAETKAVTEDSSTPAGDLAFFRDLARRVEALSPPFWEGRTEQLLNLCTSANGYLPAPIDPRQLEAAVYIHDIGMAFIPHHVINKSQKLNLFETRLLHQHPSIGAEWLKRIPDWQPAAEMVMQHHERPDGRGYPLGLSGSEICLGAKLLNIADSFFAITNTRADRGYKRSMLRAISEINGYVNSQFDAVAVHAFNQMVKARYASSRAAQ